MLDALDVNTIALIAGFLLLLLKDRLSKTPELYRLIGALEARIATQEKREIPPVLFKEQVDRVEDHARRLEDRLLSVIEKCDSIRGCPYHGSEERHLD